MSDAKHGKRRAGRPRRKGITPDITVKIDDATRANFAKRCQINALAPDERQKIEAWEDPVMVAAIKALLR